MHKTLTRGGLTACVAAFATAIALAPAAGASTGPNNTLDGCGASDPATPQTTSTCTWTADVNGGFVGAAAAWQVDRKVVVNNVTSWVKIDGGTGPFSSSVDNISLATGNTYRLTVTSGAGLMGSVTGQPGAA